MQYRLPIHPYLFALYPALSFWALNTASFTLRDTWRILLLCLLAAASFQFLASGVSRRNGKSALFSSLFVITTLYFGQVYYSIEGRIPVIGQPIPYLIAWLILFPISIYFIFRFCNDCKSLNLYLNRVSLILIIFPVWQLFASFISPSPVPQPEVKPVTISKKTFETAADRPDIYYLVLDGYGREDVLSEFFSFDNSDFLDELRQRGFYIADQSHTNYTQTVLSLSSSMIGGYLSSVGIDPTSEDRLLLQHYLDENSYIHYFNELGYKTLALDGSAPLEFNFADQYLSVQSPVNEFEIGFQSLTLGRIWARSTYEYVYWQAVHSDLDTLQGLPFDPDQPQFVFAHLLAPHPPFVFDANGNFIPDNSFMFGDGEFYKGSREDYIRGYSLKLQYLNSQLIQIVDHLLSNPYRPVIIILQADHGPGSRSNFESLENNCLRERLPILNAYYIPNEQARQKLYPSISPVNSLRLVLGQVLEQQTPLLDDRSFFSTWEHPYDYIDITDRMNNCSLLP